MKAIAAVAAALLCALSAIPVAAAAMSGKDDDYAATAYGGGTLSGAYHQCLGRNPSNAEIGRCLEDEADRQEKALNAAYRRRMAALPPGRRDALRASERAWVKQRERRCEKIYREMEDGTGAGPSQLSCLANGAIARTKWIRTFH